MQDLATTSQVGSASRQSHPQKIHSLGDRQFQPPANQLQFRSLAFRAQSVQRGLAFSIMASFFHATFSPEFPAPLPLVSVKSLRFISDALRVTGGGRGARAGLLSH